MSKTISERQAQAYRLRSMRIGGHLTIAQAAANAGITEKEWFSIEYRNSGTVVQIKRLIASVSQHPDS